MILSLLPAHTHTAPEMFFTGRDPLSTLMIPFRAHVLSGSGNRKAGGGGDEIGAAGAADMDSRTENFFALGAAGMAGGVPFLEGHDEERSRLPAPGRNQQRERLM
jgi:hypothetical protein